MFANEDRPRSCCETCFYCGLYLTKRHEHDHFPVPVRAAGTETVPACMNCHEMKDRTPLWYWPLGLYFKAVSEVLEGAPLTPMTKVDLPTDLVNLVGDYTTHWSRWTVAGRLFYGKVLALSFDEMTASGAKIARKRLAGVDAHQPSLFAEGEPA